MWKWSPWVLPCEGPPPLLDAIYTSGVRWCHHFQALSSTQYKERRLAILATCHPMHIYIIGIEVEVVPMGAPL